MILLFVKPNTEIGRPCVQLHGNRPKA